MTRLSFFVLLLVGLLCQAQKCPTFTASADNTKWEDQKTVQWWFTYSATNPSPESYTKGSSTRSTSRPDKSYTTPTPFLYFTEGLDTFQVLGSYDRDKIGIGEFLNAVVTGADSNPNDLVASISNLRANNEAYAKLFKANDAPLTAVDDEVLENIDKNWNVLQIAFNDQPSSAVDDLQTFTRKPKEYTRPAHSKIFLNIERDGSGFLIDHSYPESPFNLAQGTKRFLPLSTVRNTLVDYQHAFCLSFGAHELNDVLEMLKFSKPMPVWSNLPFVGLLKFHSMYKKTAQELDALGLDETEQLYRNLQDVVYSDYSSANECSKHWLTKYKSSTRDEIFREPLSDKCTKVAHLSNNKFTVISHAPTKISNDCFARMGPYHWLEVAKELQTPLYGQAYQNLPYLEAIAHKDWGVYIAAQLTTPYVNFVEASRKPWNNGADHSKWAIAAGNSAGKPIKNKYFVCVGDANFQQSQINHAGIAICFENDKLWEELHNMIHSLSTLEKAVLALDQGILLSKISMGLPAGSTIQTQDKSQATNKPTQEVLCAKRSVSSASRKNNNNNSNNNKKRPLFRPHLDDPKMQNYMAQPGEQKRRLNQNNNTNKKTPSITQATSSSPNPNSMDTT